jgi:hypothetical protein
MYDTSQLLSRAVLSPVNPHGHAALMVNVKPDEIFGDAVRAEMFTGEIIFVLDRSGSMGWTTRGTNRSKIETLRTAMRLSLASLPLTCAFNVISFGTKTYGLWEISQPHSQESLDAAQAYASEVEADMGGTELLCALEAVVKRRLKDKESTQIIVITDGELEPEPIIQFVWKTRQELRDQIRFFALGIGDRVSHRLIESIAEFGGGHGEVVDILQNGKWEGRINRMLRSAMEPNSWTCDIVLGPGFERTSLMAYEFGDKPRPEASLVPYIQAPSPTPPLHPFAYRSIFFLIDLGKNAPPSEVTLTTTTTGAKTKTYTRKVDRTWTDKRTIHHLATKAALAGLEAEVKQEKLAGAQTEVARHNAESLGMMYSITSKWISFVAVDRETKAVYEAKVYKANWEDISIDDLLVCAEMGDDTSSDAGSMMFAARPVDAGSTASARPSLASFLGVYVSGGATVYACNVFHCGGPGSASDRSAASPTRSSPPPFPASGASQGGRLAFQVEDLDLESPEQEPLEDEDR